MIIKAVKQDDVHEYNDDAHDIDISSVWIENFIKKYDIKNVKLILTPRTNFDSRIVIHDIDNCIFYKILKNKYDETVNVFLNAVNTPNITVSTKFEDGCWIIKSSQASGTCLHDLVLNRTMLLTEKNGPLELTVLLDKYVKHVIDSYILFQNEAKRIFDDTKNLWVFPELVSSNVFYDYNKDIFTNVDLEYDDGTGSIFVSDKIYKTRLTVQILNIFTDWLKMELSSPPYNKIINFFNINKIEDIITSILNNK